MPGQCNADFLVGWVCVRTDDGNHCTDLEVSHLAVGQFKHFFGADTEQGVGAHRAFDPAHGDRRIQAVPSNVANHDPQVASGQHERVVPVAADGAVLSWT